jgi:acyl-CoA reductase-like NAD-dependent aldehyde dehydrogenase
MALGEMGVDTRLVIHGEERSSDESFAVYDPHDGSVIGYAASATAAQAEEAVRSAQAAWPAWAALSAAERAQRALAALAGLSADAAARARTLSRENGKVLSEAQIDVAVFVGRFQRAAAVAELLDTPETIDGPPFRTSITHLPAGVVTIIYPFNWPLAILAASLPYALMAGNTVVVKPPPTTPLSSVATLRHVALALPPGVLNIVTGADAVVGPVVVGDARVKHVCFTGSVGGGRRMMQMAAANLTNVTLELGGNDPAIILEDAQLDQPMFDRLTSATFMTAGQVCMAVKRLYVPRSRYREVVEGLEASLARIRIGCGLDADVTMGPLNSSQQVRYVHELLEESRRAGAEVRQFGEYATDVRDGGHYMRPALVLDPGRDQRIVTEEQFGPALPVLPYDGEEDAIAAANDTWSGLCSSVWSADDDHASSVARRLRTGVTFFNNHNAGAVDERAPFGGFDQSGVGREMGREGLLAFTETHVMSIPSGPSPS